MRSTLAWAVVPVLAGAGVFCWQQSQIVHLRAQVARQTEPLNDGRDDPEPTARTGGLRRSGDRTAWRGDERRIILDQYRDIIAEMNLPGATASRLQDLLTSRVEAVLDAEDAAAQKGFAVGSAETARAVSLAIADFDRQIATLVGSDGDRRLNGLPPEVPAQPAVMTEPAAPLAVVNVVVQAPPAPDYADATAVPAASDAAAPYSSYPYPYYSVASVWIARRAVRPFAGARSEGVRSDHPSFEGRSAHLATRGR